MSDDLIKRADALALVDHAIHGEGEMTAIDAYDAIAALPAVDPAAIREAALLEAADAINERGKREQEDFGLNRATQNFYRSRDLVLSLIGEKK